MTNKQKKSLALAVGIFWGLSMFVITLLGHYHGYGIAFLEVIRSVYPGYSISVNGSIVGMCLGFLDGFISVYILASLYQIIERKIQ